MISGLVAFLIRALDILQTFKDLRIKIFPEHSDVI